MGALVDVRADPAVVAHGEAFFLAIPGPERETHPLAALLQRRGGADQPFVASHRCSSMTVPQRATAGRVARRSSEWAPYETATASTPALAASSRSWVVSPTIRARRGSTPVMS